MVFMSRRSLEAGILVSFAILAVGFAGFFERNETVDSAAQDVATSSESSKRNARDFAFCLYESDKISALLL